MNIGLIDVDGHHEKKKFGATVYPNIALGKLARWHLMQGDSVEWAQPINLLNSAIMTFSMPVRYSTSLLM